MPERDLAILLIGKAVAKQDIQPEEYTEANEDPAIKAFGNAAVANCLEFLGRHGLVVDVQPTFSQHGMGFVYRLDPALIDQLPNDELVAQRVSSLYEGPPSETSSTLA